jgi:ubiquinone/menaquinone biosynthesis C-methylase UbiE
MDQDELDGRIRRYYAEHFAEGDRLVSRSAGGAVEFRRVRELVAPMLAPGSRVLDVGGATGIHAAWLAESGHDVTLIDPVPEQVEAARARGGFRAEVGDARALAAPDGSADAVLLFGPLYHLASAEDRALALAEAHRVLRPGGVVAAAAISRVSAILLQILVRGFRDVPADPLARLIADGGVAPEFESPEGWFPSAHYHSAAELQAELEVAGFRETRVTGIEGPGSFALEDLALSDSVVEAALVLARAADGDAGLADLSSHLIAIARR